MNTTDIDAIRQVLIELTKGMDDKHRPEAEKLLRDDDFLTSLIAARNCDPEKFWLLHEFPREQVLRLALRVAVSEDSKVQFLLMHSNFVEMHIKRLFERFEGSSCCMDKTRTVVRAYMSFLMKNTPISFNYDAEHTYHMPKLILKSQDEIVSFIESLLHLFYGNPEQYLLQLKTLSEYKQN